MPRADYPISTTVHEDGSVTIQCGSRRWTLPKQIVEEIKSLGHDDLIDDLAQELRSKPWWEKRKWLSRHLR